MRNRLPGLPQTVRYQPDPCLVSTGRYIVCRLSTTYREAPTAIGLFQAAVPVTKTLASSLEPLAPARGAVTERISVTTPPGGIDPLLGVTESQKALEEA